MTATGCGGKASKSVPVTAVPATPTVTTTPPATATPTVTGTPHIIVFPVIPVEIWPNADLAVTNISAASLPTGDIVVRITNNGPSALTNVSGSLECSSERTTWAGGLKTALARLNMLNLNMGVGQSINLSPGLQVNTTQAWFKVTCTLKANVTDGNQGNNTRTVNIPQP